MMLQYIGAILVICACGGYGFLLAANYRREEKYLKQFLDAVHFMECELEYNLTSLPQLCAEAGQKAGGKVGAVFAAFSEQLALQKYSEPAACMEIALKESALTGNIAELFTFLGRSVGRFDLDGQRKGLQQIQNECSCLLTKMQENRDVRIRNYQTLGLCAGAALAILFI